MDHQDIQLEESALRKTTCARSFHSSIHQYLSPSVWKQAHQAWQRPKEASRWSLHAVVWTLLSMAWNCGDSQEERFATARAGYVAAHQRDRRPGKSLAGFLAAVVRLPLCVFRALAEGVRQQIALRYAERLRINGWLPLACDGTRLECPRSQQLQERLREAGKASSAPTIYLTTLVLLPLGLLWSWRLGKGTASEHYHLRWLRRTLPPGSLIVADAGFLGYDLFRAILETPASFLVRLSSRAYLYTLEQVPLARFREGEVYYWPAQAQNHGLPPIKARLLRLGNVWLLTSILDRQKLSHKTALRIYSWRWRNEGLFNIYKNLLNKVKLQSRTVATAHREAESSLLALQLLMALTADLSTNGTRGVLIYGSPRVVLLRLRAEGAAWLRLLGPRQFEDYQRMLAVVRAGPKNRRSPRVRQEWPRRKKHQPPKPPKLRVLTDRLKNKMAKVLRAA
jgi:Transposase DDE domain